MFILREKGGSMFICASAESHIPVGTRYAAMFIDVFPAAGQLAFQIRSIP